MAPLVARDELEAWHRQLRQIQDLVADGRRSFGVAEGAVGLSDAVHAGAVDQGVGVLKQIVKLVRDANERAERMCAANASASAIVQPLLGVPGEAPDVDLRPWFTRVLQRISATARRASVVDSLETLRLEVNEAIGRASTHLS